MSIFERLLRKDKSEIQSYEDLRLRIENVMGHGHLNMGAYSDDVDVSLWLPEMNGTNVTMFFDQLVMKHDGFVILITDKGDINCLSVLNIEDQSSGFKFYKQECTGEKELLILESNPKYIKKELKIPDDCWNGFVWGNKHPNQPIPSHSVPTSKYRSKYILNFSVSGEFNLEIYYVPKGNGQPIWVFGKSFCCK